MTHQEEIKKAVSSHISARVAAWFPRPFPLYGRGDVFLFNSIPYVVHMTPERYLFLVLEGNKLMKSGKIEAKESKREIDVFLFAMSSLFRFKSSRISHKARFLLWKCRNPLIDYNHSIERIRAFLELQKVDSLGATWRPSDYSEPESENQKTPEIWDELETPFFISQIVLNLWRDYGLTKEEVLKLSFPVIHQLTRAVGGESAAIQYKQSLLWSLNREKK